MHTILLLIDNPILDNGLCQLCECFIDLKLLNILDLSKCVIKTIDERISILKELKELHLENNLLTNESKTAVSELLSDLKDLKLYLWIIILVIIDLFVTLCKNCTIYYKHCLHHIIQLIMLTHFILYLHP